MIASQVLKTITSQHLISHTLPVLISLKHVLEATKSPLQGALMDFLIHLMKQNRQEVEQTLAFDPTLKAEIEYDLKQYDRQKKQVLQNQQAKVTNATPKHKINQIPSAFIDPAALPPSSIGKPVLKENVSANRIQAAVFSSHKPSTLLGSVQKAAGES